MSISGIGKVLAQLDGMSEKVGNGGYVDVGFLEGQMHSSKSGDPIPMAMVAAANEFGNPAQNRPPRPFMRDAFAAGEIEWPAKIAKIMERVDLSTKDALEYLGIMAVDDIKAAIVHFDDPPLSESTIKRKGFSKPLVDTGEMLQTGVQYKVHT